MGNQEIQELKKLNRELYKEFQDLKKQVDKLTEKIFPTAIPNYKDWDIESPEDIEVCKKCGNPTEIVVSSKTDPCALYRCFCNADFSDINNPFEGLKGCTKIDGNFNLKFKK